MRRKATIEDSEIQDEAIPGLEQDPTPTRRPPGRPRGSKTVNRKAAPKITLRDSGGRVQSKAALKQQVATELYGFASLFVGMWGLRDSCAETLTETVRLPGGGEQERLAAIVEKAVDILARNDAVLSGLATTGVIGEIGMMASLLWPVAKEVWTHHGPGGASHGVGIGDEAESYARNYPAPSLAG